MTRADLDAWLDETSWVDGPDMFGYADSMRWYPPDTPSRLYDQDADNTPVPKPQWAYDRLRDEMVGVFRDVCRLLRLIDQQIR